MTSKHQIHVKLEHDIAEFNYRVKLAKRTLLKFHLRQKWHKLTRRTR